ncbi:flagellar basal body rod protein FlgF [Solimicrobium silvestre]|uniref:Flagellar basal-body rod protein FlgF n=1 Tax=Solimicrobium silvestre TaxID=2099400 RepID=A0A2S9GVZ0_9BURK|nr:flagellar basal body rod protein FlgF [Solimicrobium silvestre]PRC91826.1 Flagellar hook-basal body protein [Solimicrobium silvestre]
MDKLIYTAMTSGKHTMAQMDTVSHNLANISTDGFRAQLDSFRAVPVLSTDLPVQTFVVDATVATNFDQGVTHTTDRTLDVSVQGHGWLVVEDANGKEAYTRAGSLKTDQNGVLQTQRGLNVLSDSGAITLPPDETITISKDGTISSIPIGNKVANGTIVGQLKLVNPPENTLVRGDDGLFRAKDGTVADADINVTVLSGSIENSNVNPVESLVNMITLARMFDMHIQLLTDAQTDDAKASTIMALS